MKNIQSIQLIEGSNEELLPGFSPDFPYIASRALLDRYLEPATPWHWHRTVELFYMESGTLEYTTPNGRWVFPTGSGGFVNSNILHTSKLIPSGVETVQLLHLFEPELLSGGQASRIDTRYIRPLTAASGIEMIVLSPDDALQAELLKKIRGVFNLNEDSWGYELILRQQLTEIWLALFELARPAMGQRSVTKDSDKKNESYDALHSYPLPGHYLRGSTGKGSTHQQAGLLSAVSGKCSYESCGIYDQLSAPESLPAFGRNRRTNHSNRLRLWPLFQQLLWKAISGTVRLHTCSLPQRMARS